MSQDPASLAFTQYTPGLKFGAVGSNRGATSPFNEAATLSKRERLQKLVATMDPGTGADQLVPSKWNGEEQLVEKRDSMVLAAMVPARYRQQQQQQSQQDEALVAGCGCAMR